ncbi:hypothetical protein [Falsihalocynthiibacter arcticus]|uniref:Uncharacterized protein n=1 Tax=Falsihalocynthiibacter arcticus TaxID=1579316 RepID=A0A126V643_9RHOB|nr:hypothetical protein [Falsihalocynthiibacter arcticus]AML53811.1 hypothetical protein RC74_21400 [Falsihalocynthiibacter arcticus]
MEYKNAIDFDNIQESLERELGLGFEGWIPKIEIGLLELKLELQNCEITPPIIVQMKERFGDLRIYTDSQEPAAVSEALEDICRHVNSSCQRCGNAAEVQVVFGWAIRLCCHCYNKFLDERFDGAESRWPDSLSPFDVANKFPDLVRPDCASLLPSVGQGWLVALGQYLKEMDYAVQRAELPPGTVQICDIKTKNRKISLSYHQYHEVAELSELRLEYATSQICTRCGHRGSRRRDKNYADCLCDYCSTKGWDPFAHN